MVVILTSIFGLFGIIVGSFLNVCVDRLPSKKSLIYPPSQCDVCQRRISPKDNIPIISFLFLRGQCRYCGARIPFRVLVLELATGFMFAGLFLNFGKSPAFPVITLYSCILLVLAVIDLEQGLLLNVIVYPSMLLAVFFNIFLPAVILKGYSPHNGFFNGLLAGAVGFVVLLLPAVISKTGMGWGDVKMAGMIGLMTGFPNVLVAVFGGVILGGIWASLLLLLKKKSRKDTIPFGPFLALGCFFALLWGVKIVEWYLKLFSPG